MALASKRGLKSIRLFHVSTGLTPQSGAKAENICLMSGRLTEVLEGRVAYAATVVGKSPMIFDIKNNWLMTVMTTRRYISSGAQ